MKFQNSPVSSFEFAGRTFYVKRDDLLDSQFNGNKARKLATYLANPPSGVKTLLSYGGCQSNLMYSLSCLAKLNDWQFNYFCRKTAKQAKLATQGNLALSLANGMQLIEIESDFKHFVTQLTNAVAHQPQNLLIKQGAAQVEAEFGLQQLAMEIKDWAAAMKFADLAVFIPSGTGASAYYLQKHLAPFKVYTTNCVGSPQYLLSQMQQLAQTQTLPLILANERFRFARPNAELLTTIRQICQHSTIEFDLVYDPVGWQILLENQQCITPPLIYLHCGGTLGNSSMLKRYQYSFNLAN